MSPLYSVFKKELRDLFRDRRTVTIQLMMAVVFGPLLLFGVMQLASDRMKNLREKAVELPVSGAQYAPNLIAWLGTQNIKAIKPPANIDEAIRTQEAEMVLVLEEGFGDSWRSNEPAKVTLVHDSTRNDTEVMLARIQGLLEAYSRTVGSLRLMARGVDPNIFQAVLVAPKDVASVRNRSGEILALILPYMLIISAFLGGAYLIIDVTAGERERQSLEPLLATPASREAIMSGKIFAACAFGLLGILLSLIGYKVVFSMIKTGVAINLTLPMIAGILLVLIPLLLIGASLLTLLAASVKSVKEAQGFMAILMILPMIPSIVLMVNPIKTQLWMYTVPFLSQNQLIVKLARGETIGMQDWGVYLASSLALAGVLWWIASRLYHRESLAISA